MSLRRTLQLLLAVGLSLRISGKWKAAVLAVVLLAGLGGFLLRYQNYLAQGATSVSARFDYWRVAGQTLADHPFVGTGPGSFGAVYQRHKPPEAEMSRLVHNDYLQQGSDGGWISMLSYGAWIFGTLFLLYRKRNLWEHPIHRATWVGLMGLACQGTIEFWLYIPAIAWVFFLLLGWLTGCFLQKAARIEANDPNLARRT